MNNDQHNFDEMYGSGGRRREPYADYHDWIETEDLARLKKQSAESEVFFRRTGITFNVYGEEEAAERLIPFDIVPRIISSREWSRLARGIEQRVRAQMTAMLALATQKGGRVPVFLRADEPAETGLSRTIHDADCAASILPVHCDWRLNERNYGALQGLNKQATREKYGDEQVHIWRRSYDVPPPEGESLELCAKRTLPYLAEAIQPDLAKGQTVLVAAHGNSLRSIVMAIEGLSTEEVLGLEIPTGVPRLYDFADGAYSRIAGSSPGLGRGAPIPTARLPTEDGGDEHRRTVGRTEGVEGFGPDQPERDEHGQTQTGQTDGGPGAGAEHARLQIRDPREPARDLLGLGSAQCLMEQSPFEHLLVMPDVDAAAIRVDRIFARPLHRCGAAPAEEEMLAHLGQALGLHIAAHRRLQGSEGCRKVANGGIGCLERGERIADAAHATAQANLIAVDVDDL